MKNARFKLGTTHYTERGIFSLNNKMPPSRKTLKRKTRTSRSQTIPALKSSFDALDHSVADIIRAKLGPKQAVKKFQESWRKIFGRPVDAAAATAYLQVKTRRNRGAKKQRGGNAPVDFQTRPGVYGTYGNFNSYVSNGFGVAVPEQAMFEGPKVNVPANMGSNKVGGGLIQSASDALFTASTRPFSPNVPPSGFFLAQESALARPMPAPAAPEQNPGLFGRM